MRGVTTLDTMNIDMANTSDSLVFDLSGGPFAPGFTPEADGTSEIEFGITNAGNARTIYVEVAHSITAGIDRLPFPHLETIQVVNLNAGVEGSSPDNDIAIHGLSAAASLEVFAGVGDDHVLASGTGAGVGAGPLNVPIIVHDYSGADVVVGGNADDVFLPGSTKDANGSFSGGAGKDTIDMSLRTAGMSISLDGVANDGIDCPGVACERDNVGSDIEAVFTGDGDDTLQGNSGPQEFNPGEGTNTVFGGGGADVINLPGLGSDTVHGGIGFDSVSYEQHGVLQNQPTGVSVTLDGVANDGSDTEGDNIEPDVEAVYGSPYGDQISGTDANDHLYGSGGSDVLVGEGGDDVLDGGGAMFRAADPHDGNDTFLGGAGSDMVIEEGHTAGMKLSIDGFPNDVVTGVPREGRDNIYTDVENVVAGPFDDTITGNGAGNRLEGGGGDDVLRGLGGPDTLLGDEGDDTLDGGSGKDSCLQGPGTGTVTGCES